MMRKSSFQVRWYFKRQSLHVSCCLLFHAPLPNLILHPKEADGAAKALPYVLTPWQQPTTSNERFRDSATHVKSYKGLVSPPLHNRPGTMHVLKSHPTCWSIKRGLEKKQVLHGAKHSLPVTNANSCCSARLV